MTDICLITCLRRNMYTTSQVNGVWDTLLLSTPGLLALKPPKKHAWKRAWRNAFNILLLMLCGFGELLNYATACTAATGNGLITRMPKVPKVYRAISDEVNKYDRIGDSINWMDVMESSKMCENLFVPSVHECCTIIIIGGRRTKTLIEIPT